jgi:hypothetical protein
MKKITFDLCEKALKEVLEIKPEEAQNYAQQMLQSQPYMLIYLTTAAENNEIFNNAEIDILLSLGLTIWKIFYDNYKEIETIPEENIFKYDDENLNFVKSMASEDNILQSQEKLNEYINNYPQSEILKFIFQVLLENCRISDLRIANLFPLFIYLKTEIDCFVSAVKSEN